MTPPANRIKDHASTGRSRQLFALAVAPSFILSMLYLSQLAISPYLKALIIILLLSWLAGYSYTFQKGFSHHVRTLSILIEALKNGDYSLRGGGARHTNDLGELYGQINALSDELMSSRAKENELFSLLEKIMDQIRVSIIVLDSNNCIQLLNKSALALLKMDAAVATGLQLTDSPLANIPLDSNDQLIDHAFPGASGRWQIQQQEYREQGRPGKIIYITDLKQVLSQEELSAWKRLIRVIAHEVNNSLSPIISICQTLQSLNQQQGETGEAAQALEVIQDRAASLKTFISGYAEVARLPEPQKHGFVLNELLLKIQRFFNRSNLRLVETEGQISLYGDPVHIEQLLINLIKNALEASAKTQGIVEIEAIDCGAQCEIRIKDQGPGISNPANLFVPFYTTKAKGTGIGLVLCRQIAAAHHGSVTLINRKDGAGAIATAYLPKIQPGL
jgi:nitrogen fixation/metabolism regulation signal transduction histidine kinase